MILTPQQVQTLLAILSRYQLVFIAGQLGVDYLSPQDRATLTAAGVDLTPYTNSQGVITHAFLFGMLADALGAKRAKNMTYDQFQRFVAGGGFVPLTEAEEFALAQVKARAYTDITNLGARMRGTVANAVIRNNTAQAAIVARMIRAKTAASIEARTGARALAADLARTTGDWEVDWLRLAHYLTHEAYNTGRAQSILKTYGAGAQVYFDVYEGACTACRKLYLTDPNDPYSEPKTFLLTDVIANGNNIGRRAADYLPTVGPVHPYCRCTLTRRDPNMDWDATVRAFTRPRVKTSSKIPSGTKLNIKITR